MNLSFQKLFFPIATLCAIFAILIIAKAILIPLGFALLISFILFPLTKKYEAWGINRILSALLSILTLLLIFACFGYFFFTQISNLPNDLLDFKEKIMQLLADLILFVNTNLNLKTDLESTVVLDQIKDWIKITAFPLVENTFRSTTSFITKLVLTIIYTFLILIYRNGLTMAFVKFSSEENQLKVLYMLKRVQKVGQKYLSGMILLIIILGLANSIGLSIIGIDSPFLFGFLAAIMSIVPYVGTTLGATIPVLYAFMTYDSLWVPIAVAAMFWSIQVIESNFLSPKIVGSSLNVNVLAAILSLLIGAYVWGVAGMILFLPFAAMLKAICNDFQSLHPVSLLIDSRIYYGEEDNDKHVIKLWGKMKIWIDKLKKHSN